MLDNCILLEDYNKRYKAQTELSTCHYYMVAARETTPCEINQQGTLEKLKI